MRTKSLIVLLLFGIVGAFKAQTTENLERSVIATTANYDTVEYGHFQVELTKTLDLSEVHEGFWFSYIYVATNKYKGTQTVYVKGNSLMGNRDFKVRTYRIGPTLDKCIFVMKNLDANATDIGYNMEFVRAYVNPYLVCDTVVDINDDGFVFRIGDKFQYCPYNASGDGQVGLKSVVWPVRKVYDGDDTGMPVEQKLLFSHLSEGDVYYESEEGHYYYLYRDDYMPYSVLVIDNKAYELYDRYTEDNFRLKYSFNGKHWMAVGNKYYWVDGVMKSVEGYQINDFVVTDDGHYGYRANMIDSNTDKEVVVADGQILRRNARVTFFGLNEEGRLKFRFIAGERLLEYENDMVTDVSKAMVSTYYPGNPVYNEPVVVMSDDGHWLTYQKGVPGVEIDGKKFTESTPCHAIYDKRNHVFVWNAIENVGEKQELVIYKYSVPSGLFKNLFK
ncbi:MAG: hypothetical protein K6A28_07645 [Bacteroidales bacterium]|nr:hypothetical protein [Bacteroidales bacterium]